MPEPVSAVLHLVMCGARLEAVGRAEPSLNRLSQAKPKAERTTRPLGDISWADLWACPRFAESPGRWEPFRGQTGGMTGGVTASHALCHALCKGRS